MTKEDSAGRDPAKRRMRDRPELELVKIAKDNSNDLHDEAMEEILRRHHEMLVGIARKLVRPNDVDDVVQEAYLNVFRNLDRYDAEVGSLTAWSATILRRRAVDHHRRRETRLRVVRDGSSITDEVDVPDEDPGPNRVDAEMTVSGLLPNLRPREREALELRYLEDLSYREIAERMDVTVGTVKTNLNRALRALRTSR
jgi:RNA polymerase sigma factor (sigma-70 family)